MKRSYLLKNSSIESEDNGQHEVVNSGQMKESFSRKLKKYDEFKPTFVRSTNNTFNSKNVSFSRVNEKEEKNVLSVDEKNKINAKILKAELKGDMDLVEKLKRKLEGVIESKKDDNDSQRIMLLKIDERTGNMLPVVKKHEIANISDKSTVNSVYEKCQSVGEMVIEEKTTTSIDQITMFSKSTKAMGKLKTDDDFVVDDQLMEHKRKKRDIEKDGRKEFQRTVQGKFQHIISKIFYFYKKYQITHICT
uniref:Uncharacterized protein n=1 Tax=Parastrongyloides trichosuri TaxID=131310 RepID=A0A0N4ZKC4_PARTI